MAHFLEPLCDGHDVAKGTRFKGDGGSSDMLKHRVFGNLLFVKMINLLYRAQYTDVAYGYNALRRDCLAKINLSSDGFEIETEMAIKFKKAGLRIIEVPSYEDARLNGTGKLQSVRDGRRILMLILKEFFHG